MAETSDIQQHQHQQHQQQYEASLRALLETLDSSNAEKLVSLLRSVNPQLVTACVQSLFTMAIKQPPQQPPQQQQQQLKQDSPIQTAIGSTFWTSNTLEYNLKNLLKACRLLPIAASAAVLATVAALADGVQSGTDSDSATVTLNPRTASNIVGSLQFELQHMPQKCVVDLAVFALTQFRATGAFPEALSDFVSQLLLTLGNIERLVFATPSTVSTASAAASTTATAATVPSSDECDIMRSTVSSMAGSEFKATIIEKVLAARWRPSSVATTITVLRDSGLSATQIEQLITKIQRMIVHLPPSEIPPTIGQLLLVGRTAVDSTGPAQQLQMRVVDIIIDELDRILNQQEVNKQPQHTSSQMLAGIGTAMIHVGFATKQSLDLFTLVLRTVKTRGVNRLSPVTLGLLLSVGQAHQYTEQVVELVRSMLQSSTKENDRLSDLPWIASIINNDSSSSNHDAMMAFKESMQQVVIYSADGWDQVLTALIPICTALIDTSQSSASLSSSISLRSIGVDCLVQAYVMHEQIRDTVVSSIVGAIGMRSSSTSGYIALLSRLASQHTHLVVEYASRLREIIFDLPFLSHNNAIGFITAIRPLIWQQHQRTQVQSRKPSGSSNGTGGSGGDVTMLRAALILALRKCMNATEVGGRQIALTGFALLIRDALSQQSNSNNSNNTSNTSNNTGNYNMESIGLAHELCGVLKRCLSQQYEVRNALYATLTSMVMQFPDSLMFLEVAFELIYNHVNRYYQPALTQQELHKLKLQQQQQQQQQQQNECGSNGDEVENEDIDIELENEIEQQLNSARYPLKFEACLDYTAISSAATSTQNATASTRSTINNSANHVVTAANIASAINEPLPALLHCLSITIRAIEQNLENVGSTQVQLNLNGPASEFIDKEYLTNEISRAKDMFEDIVTRLAKDDNHSDGGDTLLRPEFTDDIGLIKAAKMSLLAGSLESGIEYISWALSDNPTDASTTVKSLFDRIRHVHSSVMKLFTGEKANRGRGKNPTEKTTSTKSSQSILLLCNNSSGSVIHAKSIIEILSSIYGYDEEEHEVLEDTALRPLKNESELTRWLFSNLQSWLTAANTANTNKLDSNSETAPARRGRQPAFPQSTATTSAVSPYALWTSGALADEPSVRSSMCKLWRSAAMLIKHSVLETVNRGANVESLELTESQSENIRMDAISLLSTASSSVVTFSSTSTANMAIQCLSKIVAQSRAANCLVNVFSSYPDSTNSQENNGSEIISQSKSAKVIDSIISVLHDTLKSLLADENKQGARFHPEIILILDIVSNVGTFMSSLISSTLLSPEESSALSAVRSKHSESIASICALNSIHESSIMKSLFGIICGPLCPPTHHVMLKTIGGMITDFVTVSNSSVAVMGDHSGRDMEDDPELEIAAAIYGNNYKCINHSTFIDANKVAMSLMKRAIEDTDWAINFTRNRLSLLNSNNGRRSSKRGRASISAASIDIEESTDDESHSGDNDEQTTATLVNARDRVGEQNVLQQVAKLEKAICARLLTATGSLSSLASCDNVPEAPSGSSGGGGGGSGGGQQETLIRLLTSTFKTLSNFIRYKSASVQTIGVTDNFKRLASFVCSTLIRRAQLLLDNYSTGSVERLKKLEEELKQQQAILEEKAAAKGKRKAATSGGGRGGRGRGRGRGRGGGSTGVPKKLRRTKDGDADDGEDFDIDLNSDIENDESEETGTVVDEDVEGDEDEDAELDENEEHDDETVSDSHSNDARSAAAMSVISLRQKRAKSAASRLKRESQIVPALTYEIEQCTRHILGLANKVPHEDLTHGLTNRPPRILNFQGSAGSKSKRS